MRYLQDFDTGQIISLLPYTVREVDIIDFAHKFDPQPFHLDAADEKTKALGGLMASGWHTAAIVMRMKVDAYLLDTATLTSPGIDNLRWLAPVRAGDVLSGYDEVTAVRRLKSQPDRGVLSTKVRIKNQTETLVMTLEAAAFVMVRPTD